MENTKKRVKYAVILSGCGCLVSLGLAILKLYVGLRSNSLCIMLDSINSFFDVLTGAVAVAAFCLLLRPKSEEHPFGFGRAEYLAGFVVAAVSVVMGGAFFFRSVNRMAMPEPVYYRLSSLILMLVALVVKIGMAVAYGVANRRIRSRALRALLLDSVLDVGVTAVSVVSFTLSVYVAYVLDAWLGLAVSVVVVAVGVKTVVDNVRLLVGGGDLQEAQDAVRQACLAQPGIVCVRQIVLADYGYRNQTGYVVVQYAPELSLFDSVAVAKAVAAQLQPMGIYVRLVADDASFDANEQVAADE